MKKLDNKAFTLVELIIVILILAILMGVSITGYSKYIHKAKESTDIQNTQIVKEAIEMAQYYDGLYEEIQRAYVSNPSEPIIYNIEFGDSSYKDCKWFISIETETENEKRFTIKNESGADCHTDFLNSGKFEILGDAIDKQWDSGAESAKQLNKKYKGTISIYKDGTIRAHIGVE